VRKVSTADLGPGSKPASGLNLSGTEGIRCSRTCWFRSHLCTACVYQPCAVESPMCTMQSMQTLMYVTPKTQRNLPMTHKKHEPRAIVRADKRRVRQAQRGLRIVCQFVPVGHMVHKISLDRYACLFIVFRRIVVTRHQCVAVDTEKSQLFDELLDIDFGTSSHGYPDCPSTSSSEKT